MDELIFFSHHLEWRQWLEENHATAEELWVGYFKKGAKKPTLTWPESVDHALCFGWIDGIRKSIDGDRYKIRFTPRRPRSIWSAVNLKRIEELLEEGLMQPAGIKAYETRDEKKTNQYSFERENIALDPGYEAEFKANAKAWAFFQAQVPSYRKPAIHWVMSAKQEATRLKRLATLIKDSEEGERIAPLRRYPR